ncbi:MAG TPA: class I SAM-dependent methyltransferase, partial [Polyangiaceae bacterium]
RLHLRREDQRARLSRGPTALLDLLPLRRALRGASDWVDLAWSLLVADLERAAPFASGRLLDVGCGTKPYEHIFRPYVTEYLGIEHEATFERTQASADERKPDLYYDGKRLPFDDGTFDTVLNAQVLEHTPEPARLVTDMARVLKEGGTLILSAPFQFRLHERPHDYFRYTPYGLRALCADAGLEIVEELQQGSLWSVLAHKLNSFLALRVSRIGGLAQAMGKLSHESVTTEPARLWTLPVVGPVMLATASAARVMERVSFEPDESLGYLFVARKTKRPR